DNLRGWSWLGRLAQHVGIDKVAHNVSVGSDSIGTKNPFSGQARSHSHQPSFLGGSCRIRRYSLRLIRLISNFCPGSTPSCFRNSAGSTIWPLLETVVVMRCKMPSYLRSVKAPKRSVSVTLAAFRAFLLSIAVPGSTFPSTNEVVGGRPLRRRRETVLNSADRGCEGPQPSRPAPKRMGHWWPIPWRASAPSAP